MVDLNKHDAHRNWSECTACGRWFTTDSAFDAHIGSVPKKGRPICKDPARVHRGTDRLRYDPVYEVWHWGHLSVADKAARLAANSAMQSSGSTTRLAGP